MGSIIFLIPMLRGRANSVFFNTSAAGMLQKTGFLNITNGFINFLSFLLSWTRHVAALFVFCCEHEVPALRGDHIFDADVRQVNSLDVEGLM